MRQLTFLLGTLVVAGVLLSDAPAAAQGSEPVTIPMELMANRPVIRVTINGQGPYAFLIAPEDQATVIDRELAEALKFKELAKEAEKAAEKAKDGRDRVAPPVNGGTSQATVLLGFGATTKLKPLTLAVSVGDVARSMPEVAGAVRPRGIISLSVWKDQLVTLDYARWLVMLQPGTLPEPNGKEVFALTQDRQLHLSLSLAEQQSIDCLVDPLFPEGLLLPPAYSAALQLDGTPRDWGVVKTREGTVRVKEAKLAGNLMLGPFEMRTPLVMLAETGETATVGTRWLGRFSVTYDLANGRARLDRIMLPAGGR